MEGNDLAGVVDMMYIDIIASETAGCVVPVAFQLVGIAYHLHIPCKCYRVCPAVAYSVMPVACLEVFLTLEEHRDTGAENCRNQSETGALLGPVASCIIIVNILNQTLLTVGSGTLVMAFSVFHTCYRVAVIKAGYNIPYCVHVAVSIIANLDLVTHGVDEVCVPLAVEACAAFTG